MSFFVWKPYFLKVIYWAPTGCPFVQLLGSLSSLWHITWQRTLLRHPFWRSCKFMMTNLTNFRCKNQSRISSFLWHTIFWCRKKKEKKVWMNLKIWVVLIIYISWWHPLAYNPAHTVSLIAKEQSICRLVGTYCNIYVHKLARGNDLPWLHEDSRALLFGI